ncbi:chitobiase/beta-hexosaminidase C-terminal domain-containing protein [Solimonas flava]|uniref:chitobiase/beta-hexosaminidase C-terminal domain-containing protein n=1 Tax=Solimonas flava TaxID=415849 RepID=UPI001FDF6E81|nr:chitobiase/beta-hexosaminidase C-terminal domain-containing protein [Solimonas flava]
MVMLLHAPIASAQSATLRTLHSFAGSADGSAPLAALVQGTDGNFYGTTRIDGAGGFGTAFKITPTGTLTTLYTFNGGANGGQPAAPLLEGSDGNFYGTTQSGGNSGHGTAFRLSPSGTLTTLYSFSGGADGGAPSAALVAGSDGKFYGTTSTGGSGGYGTLFKLTSSGSLTTLHAFDGITDGLYPEGDLVLGDDGNLYGTASGGGDGGGGCGTAFRSSTDGTFALLHTFTCGSDGEHPAGLALGLDGQFYGVTHPSSGSDGSFFRLTKSGSVSVLHFFSDSDNPAAALVQGTDGNFYGMTDGNRRGSGCGTAFTISPTGAFKALYTLACDGSTGAYPKASLIQAQDGAFYGTTSGGGPQDKGTIFKLVITAAAAPTFSPAAGTYTGTQTVTLSSSTAGAAIHYTTDGTAPTLDSPLYSGPLTVSGNTTIKAIAVAGGFATSAVATAAYTIQSPAATPTFSPSAGTYTRSQAVTISDSTPGATIHYTLDGSTPTATSSVYNSPITVSQSATIKALAVASGYGTSAIASATYTITPPADAPSFSPAAGTYTSIQSVTLSSATAGAKIHFTTDGSTPTSASTTYASPIRVAQTQTIKAIAAASGYADSPVATAKYTINLPTATPIFSPGGGTYSAAQSVTISDTTPGATIHFTTDGSTPSTGSPTYSSPIAISKTTTLKAIAVASGYSTSAVASASFTIQVPTATPSFSPGGSTYSAAQSVTISDATTGAKIYFSTDGSTPTASSTPYTGPISVARSLTLKALAVADGYTASAVASATYTITPPAATPTFSPGGGTYTSAQTVAITSSTPAAVIRYTTDGSAPNAGSAQYSAPITVSSSLTLKAIATASGHSASAVASASYTITPPAAQPIFTPAAGTYHSAQSVTISDSTPGATIFYTTDGSQPGVSSSVYAGPVNVPSSTTLKAIAMAPGYSASPVTSAKYTIVLPAAAPTFSPAGGTYAERQVVTITDTTPGAVIHYTQDGSAPTTDSPVYNSPLSIASTTTVKAMAVAAGYTNSPVTTAEYVISPAGDGGGAADPWLLSLMALAASLRRRLRLRHR